MRKRIFAFVMAVVVAVGCVGYRPQKVYAEELLAVGACEVLYALLLSMGVVISSDASYEEKIEATQEFYNSMDAKGRMAFTHILVASSVVGDLYSWGSGLNRSDLAELWDSVMGAKADQISYSPPIAGFQSYSFPSDGSANFYSSPVSLGTCADSPFIVFTGSDGSSQVFALLPAGYYLEYVYNRSSGVVSNVLFGSCSLDTKLFLGLKYFNSTSLYRTCFASPAIGGFNTTGGLSWYSNKFGGVAWGNASSAYIAGTIFTGAMTYYDGVAIRDEGLTDCDTWADSMSRTGEVDKEVGVITGKDLSGYNSSEDAYDGLITGVNNPALPVPVDGDLGTIAGGLQSILNWLKSWLDKLINALTSLLTALFVPTTTALSDFINDARGKLPVIDNFFNIDLNSYVTDDGKPRWFFVYQGVEYDIFDMDIFDRFRYVLHAIIIAIAYYRFYKWVLKSLPSVIKGR